MDRATWDARWNDDMVLYKLTREKQFSTDPNIQALVSSAKNGSATAMASLRDFLWADMTGGSAPRDLSIPNDASPILGGGPAPESACPACGRRNAPGSAFCAACGQRLAAAVPAPRPGGNQGWFAEFIWGLVDFRGVSTRSRFALAYLGTWVVGLLLIVVLAAALASDPSSADLWTVVLLPMVYMLWVACIRRLHDLGHSGWFLLWGLIPFVGIGIFIWLFFAESDWDSSWTNNGQQANARATVQAGADLEDLRKRAEAGDKAAETALREIGP